MDLQAWIESLSDGEPLAAAAAKLGEKPRTVYSWLRYERAPSIRAAINIVRIADGAVDFNGIYAPFMRAREADHARV